jgi:hypothetical protein
MSEPNPEEWRYPPWFLDKLRDRCLRESGEDMQWEQIEAVLHAYSGLTGHAIATVDGGEKS